MKLFYDLDGRALLFCKKSVLLRFPKFPCALLRHGNFDRCASSAQTPLIVFLTEKLTASLCFLFPKKSSDFSAAPNNRFIVRRTRFGDDAKKTFLLSELHVSDNILKALCASLKSKSLLCSKRKKKLACCTLTAYNVEEAEAHIVNSVFTVKHS